LLKRIISEIMLIMLLSSVWMFALAIQPAKAEPGTIKVPEDYPTIQQAINAANPGDTILVSNGIYNENIVVDKTLRLIGEDRHYAIINGATPDGLHGKDTVNITASGCVLENFTIINGSRPGKDGVRLNSSNNIVRYNNICNNRDDGIFVESCSNTVANNTISHNKEVTLFSGVRTTS